MDLADFLTNFEKIAELPTRLESIETKLDRLLISLPHREYITIADICIEIGCNRGYIRTRPWILPNYGIPDLAGRPKRWRLSTWEMWLAQGLEIHRQAWISFSEEQRRRIVKEVAA